ncbi:hypothetical protein ATERTT37_000867 [Aspergillus terreus]
MGESTGGMIRPAVDVLSLEMSQEGQDMAGEEPYLVHNGWTRELVVTQPEHVQEFYRKDGKGSSEDQPESKADEIHLNDLHEPLMLDAIFGKWTPYKLFNFLPTEFRSRLKKFERSWERLNDEVLAKAREFLQTMYELLYTNIDVTSTVTSFLLLNISANQSFQSKLREEIQARQNEPSYKLMDYVEKKDTLLHYAVMESLRMSPALWFSLPEKTATDKIIGGYHIPAGTPTIIDWKRLNTTPEIWGADSEVFCPERFASISPTAYRYAFLRFGIGSRRCMGQNIAIVMLKMAVIEVLRRYSMKVGYDSGIRNDRFTVTSEGEIEFISIEGED